MRPEPTRLRAHTTKDLLSVVPYLLGYQPSEQIVLLVVVDKRVQVTAALHLSHFENDPDDARRALRTVVDPFEGGSVLMAVWSHDERLAEEVLAATRVWCADMRLIDSVVVGERRWHSSAGIRPRDSGSTRALQNAPAAAQAVVAGLAVAASRAEAVGMVDGPVDADLELFERVEAEMADWRPNPVEAVTFARELSRREPTPAECARLVMMVQHRRVRDAVWVAMDAPHGDEHCTLWERVVACTPGPWALTPVLLLGCAAWAAGSGAVMVACIERALRLDPNNQLAQLLSSINLQALPPREWEAMRAALIFGHGGDELPALLAS